MDQEEARRLLDRFDAAVDRSGAGAWLRSLDESASLRDEVPLEDHSDSLTTDDPPDSSGQHWKRDAFNQRWFDARHQEELGKEQKHFEELWGSRVKRSVAHRFTIPALLGHVYHGSPEQEVPGRYYWTFVPVSGSGPQSSRSAQETFYTLLEPAQTVTVLRRVFRSKSWQQYWERVYTIPAAAPHLLNLLAANDEVVLRHFLLQTFGFVTAFGPSHALLGSLIEAAEKILLRLGSHPFRIDDDRLHLQALHWVVKSTFEVANDLEPSGANRTFVPRLRGLLAQLELQWPRRMALPPRMSLRVLGTIMDTGKLDHPADWIRSALSAIEAPTDATLLPRALPQRLDAAAAELANYEPASLTTFRLHERTGAVDCGTCMGRGLIKCRDCGGRGHRSSDAVIRSMQAKWKKDPDTYACSPCAAIGYWPCEACGGTGESPV